MNKNSKIPTLPLVNRGLRAQVTKTFGYFIDLKLKAINGLFVGNHGRAIIKYLLKIIDVLHPHRTASDVKLVIRFAFWATNLCKSQGLKGLVMHLKVCQVLVQQATGGYRVSDLGPLKRRVNRSRTGFPRIIPTTQRALLTQGDGRAIKLWLSLFGIYRILEFTGQVSTTTITEPGVEIPGSWLQSWETFAEQQFLPGFLSHLDKGAYAALRATQPLPVPFPIQKGGPTTAWSSVLKDINGTEVMIPQGSSSLIALALSARL